jgi:D-glucosaminate-6-phosphate ammonia-lyase
VTTQDRRSRPEGEGRIGEMTRRGAYESIGASPAINARGIYSELGGWSLTEALWSEIGEANRYSASMPQLLDSSGAVIAQLLGTEAARVTPGVSATIVLAVAGFISKGDGESYARLPDTAGLPNEIVIQRNHRYMYDRMVSMAGGVLREVGDDRGTASEDFERALTARTAGVFVPAHLDGHDGTLPLARVVDIAHGRDIPVLVDAAYLVFPLDEMRRRAREADVVAFSAKYWGGPNSGGVACGSAEQIEAIRELDFTGYEGAPHKSLGRPFKLDRWTIVGTALSLRDWLAADHDLRFAAYAEHLQRIAAALPAWCDATAMNFTMENVAVPGPPVNCLTFDLPDEVTAAEFEKGLEMEDPVVLVHRRGAGIIVDVECVHEDDVDTLAHRLAEQLGRVQP